MRPPDSCRQRPYRRLTTTQTVLAACVLAALGLLCLYLGGSDGPWWLEHKGFQGVVRDLGSLLIVSVTLGAIWELVGKRAFAREVLETARIAADVETAGLTRVGTNYMQDPDWEDLFRNVQELDIFVAYASTWRNTHLSRLQALASRPDGQIRVFLPDPEHRPTISTLASRFGYTKENLQGRIEDTRKSFAEMTVDGGATIEVYYRQGDRLFSFYRFDSRAVITLYNHRGTRESVVPTFAFQRGGSLYAFIEGEIRAITKQSRLASERSATKAEVQGSGFAGVAGRDEAGSAR